MSNYRLIRLKRFARHFQLNYVINYFLQLHLILYACIRRFDVTGTIGKFLELNRAYVLQIAGQ